MKAHMKAKLRMAGIATAFVLVLIPDLAEAQAGGRRRRTRRRTAVVVHSATKAQDQQAAEQQAAAPQEQQPAAGGTLAVGTVVPSLPAGCVTVTVDEAEYYHCGADWYRKAYQGDALVYVVTEPPQ